MNIKNAIENVLSALQDEEQSIWNNVSEIERYLREGYDRFARETLCIFDIAYADNVPYAGSHTAEWEVDFLVHVNGEFQLTGGEWEHAYIDNGIGPAGITSPWEADYANPQLFLGTSELPHSLIEVDRVTYDNYRIQPFASAQKRQIDPRYQLNAGPTHAYAFDEDGTYVIRKIPFPAASADVYDFSGSRGFLRVANGNEFGTDEDIIGTRGILRVAPEHFPSGRRGGIKAVHRDGANVRVEMFRKGVFPEEEFEIPDRYVKYLEYYAIAKALHRESAGQDLKLSEHFMLRFESAVARTTKRMALVQQERMGTLGPGGRRLARENLQHLPWQYGENMPFREG
jgi:hypothetical protein